MMTSKKSAATLGTALVAARAQAHDLQDKVGPTVHEARERLAPMVADARERITPKVTDARERINPVVVDARGRINPVVLDAKVRLADLAEAVSSKLEEAEAAAAVEKKAAKKAAKNAGDKESKKALKQAAKTAAKVKAAQKTAQKAARKAAESSGEHAEDSKSGGKLKTLLLLGVLGAVAAFVAKKFSGSSEPQWQSTAPGRPVPPPAPSTPPAPTDAAGAVSGVGGMVAAEDAADPLATDVAGGGTPDEAAADALDGPHAPTTPDSPAEEIDLDKP